MKEYVDTSSRTDAEVTVFASSPFGVALQKALARRAPLKETHSSRGRAPRQGLLQGNRGVAEFVHAA